MSIAIFTSFAAQLDASGNPLSGGSVTLYQAGTTTLINNYTASDLSGSPASNPITLDSAGKHAMRYFALQAYKVLLKNSAGATITTFDNIDPGVAIGSGVLAITNGGTGAASAGAALTALGGATAASVASIATDVAALVGASGSTEKTHIATGSTAQRPAVPAEGDFRRNTTSARYEAYNGSATWINFIASDTLLADTRSVIPATTFQYLTSGSSATYTAPTGPAPRTIRIKMVGGGGGGSGATANNGSAGGATSFNSITAAGGSGGGAGSGGAGGVGGTGGSGSVSLRINGSSGDAAQNGADFSCSGSSGGPGYMGMGAGRGTTGGGGAGAANTGAGGAGGGGTNTGAGGGSGEYAEFLITSPAATYTYTIGTAGSGGAAGGQVGGNGGTGLIIVEEYY